jgi:hypothetical protein
MKYILSTILITVFLNSCISKIERNKYTSIEVDPTLTLEKKILQFKDSLKNGSDSIAFLFKVAIYHTINKENDSAFKYLYLATNMDTTGELFENGAFYNLFKDPRWALLEQLVFNKEFKKLKIKDTNTVKALWRGKIIDQSYFTEISFYDRKLGYGNRISDSLFRLRGKATPKMLLYALKLIDSIGWPKESEYTKRGGRAVFLLLQHSTDSIMKKYLPLLEAACKNSEADCFDYARMKDRVLISMHKPQLYGTHYDKYDEKTNTYVLCLTEDTMNTDKRRAALGLESLKAYYKTDKIYYSKTY